MKYLLPLMMALLLGGCVAPQPRIGIFRPKTPSAVATLEMHRTGSIEYFSGYEARCQIRSIDGVTVDSVYELLPGNHTLTVSLTHLGRDYVGDVDLIIPEAKNYELRAKRKGDSFMLSIVDSETNKPVAISTAPLDDHMKFLVFVVQK